MQDKKIGRRIFKLLGKVAASNYIEIPCAASRIKSLALTGKYVYLEFCFFKQKYFNLHLDFAVRSNNPVRVTLTNLFSKQKKIGNSISLPIDPALAGNWICACLDIEALLTAHGFLDMALAMRKTKSKKASGNLFTLKYFKACASLKFRGLFTSDNLYEWRTLPNKMTFRKPA